MSPYLKTFFPMGQMLPAKFMKGKLISLIFIGTNSYARRYRSFPPAHIGLWAIQEGFGHKVAIFDTNKKSTYEDLFQRSLIISGKIEKLHKSCWQSRIAYITCNDANFVHCNWGIWHVGGVAVPLCNAHPVAEIDYILQDCKPVAVISSSKYDDMISSLARKHKIPHLQSCEDFCNLKFDKHLSKEFFNKQFKNDLDALMIYTSGTTGKPKGVMWQHGKLNMQVRNMLKSWKWTHNDSILHVLPLHHFHGLVNALYCPLAVGAKITMLPKFDVKRVWEIILTKDSDISLLMAVPTIYVKLLQYFDKNLSQFQSEITQACKRFRLMVSGSAALPTSTYSKWESITGVKLLERYGMTEVGMVLTNSYSYKRVPGAVGLPFPNMEVKIVDEKDFSKTLCWANHQYIRMNGGSKPGALLVRGEIFDRYWGNQDAMGESFTADGWFVTGDTAIFEQGVFRILGRTSVDIIKTSGFKISALEVERELLNHRAIAEIAIVGVADSAMGQIVSAIVVPSSGSEDLTLSEIQEWCGPRLAKYKVPRKLLLVKDIPKNAMGKINKKRLVNLFIVNKTV